MSRVLEVEELKRPYTTEDDHEDGEEEDGQLGTFALKYNSELNGIYNQILPSPEFLTNNFFPKNLGCHLTPFWLT